MFCSFDQMVVHARSGGTIEVMGLMQGKTDGDTIIIMDAFALPVEGTETRVNAQADAYEYMVQYSQTNKQVLFLSPPTMPVKVIWTIWSVFSAIACIDWFWCNSTCVHCNQLQVLEAGCENSIDAISLCRWEGQRML